MHPPHDDDNKLHAHAQDLTVINNQDSSAGFPQQLLDFRHIMMSKIESKHNTGEGDLCLKGHEELF